MNSTHIFHHWCSNSLQSLSMVRAGLVCPACVICNSLNRRPWSRSPLWLKLDLAPGPAPHCDMFAHHTTFLFISTGSDPGVTKGQHRSGYHRSPRSHSRCPFLLPCSLALSLSLILPYSLPLPRAHSLSSSLFLLVSLQALTISLCVHSPLLSFHAFTNYVLHSEYSSLTQFSVNWYRMIVNG